MRLSSAMSTVSEVVPPLLPLSVRSWEGPAAMPMEESRGSGAAAAGGARSSEGGKVTVTQQERLRLSPSQRLSVVMDGSSVE